MKSLLSFGLLLTLSLRVYAQEEPQADKTWKLSQLIQDQHFQIAVRFVQPMALAQRYVGADGYTFRVNKDRVQSDLPYIGRSYSAPMNTSDIGMKFISNEFSYVTGKARKDRWQISIRPRDLTDVREIIITVFSNGTADIRINSVNRQAIAYRGEIMAIPAG